MPTGGPTIDLTSTIAAYATFAAVLAGFAFAGLCVYLTRGKFDQDGKEHHTIEVKHVSAAVFYAMASLGISSFLYANLVSIAMSYQGATEAAILCYGVVFALSVLSLFYAVTLMMLENPLTREAAKHAYWATTIAGTILVLRFLAGAARDAIEVRYFLGETRKPPPFPGMLSLQGIFYTLMLAGLLSVFSTVELQKREPVGKRAKRTTLPLVPPGAVFIAAVFVTTTLSPYFSSRNTSYAPSSLLIYASYIISILGIAFFAFICGRVVAPRARIFVDDSQDGRTKLPVRIARGRSLTFILYLAMAFFAIMLFSTGPQNYLSLWVLLPALLVLIAVIKLRGPKAGSSPPAAS